MELETDIGGLPGRRVSRRDRSLSVIVLVCALMMAAWTFYANHAFYHDDAYITLRYARNLLAGEGAVWNPGERVQGYTSVLELGLVSGLGSLGIDLRLASQMIGVSCYVALVAWLVRLQWRSSGKGPVDDPLWGLPVVLTAASCPMIVWSLAGLESVPFSLMMAMGCLLFVGTMGQPVPWRGLAGSAVCFGLGFLVRPDGGLFAAISVAWLLMAGEGPRVRCVTLFCGVWLAIVAPCEIWQYLYYGDLVPNTFYAKATDLSLQQLWRGIGYVGEFARQPPYMPLILAVLLVWGRFRRLRAAPIRYLLSIVLAWCVYLAAVGGDHMPAYRMMLPVVVPLAYLVYLCLKPGLGSPGRQRAGAIYAVSLALLALQLRSAPLNPTNEDKASRVGTMVGRYIERAWPAGSLVALNSAGSTPFYAPDLRFIDMLGLNDRHIARRSVNRISLPMQEMPGHAKGDGAYVLARAPDYIIIGPAEGTDAKSPWFLSDLEMGRSPGFAADYQERVVLLADRKGNGDPSQDSVIFTYYERVKR